MAGKSWLEEQQEWLGKQDGGRWGAFAVGGILAGGIASLFFRPGLFTSHGEQTGWIEGIIGFFAYPLMVVGVAILGGYAATSFWAKGGDEKIVAAVDSGAKTVGGWGTSIGKALGLVSLDADPSIPKATLIAAVDTVIDNPAHQFRQLAQPLAHFPSQEASAVHSQTISATQALQKTQQISA